jgi:hypothetical protein
LFPSFIPFLRRLICVGMASPMQTKLDLLRPCAPIAAPSYSFRRRFRPARSRAGSPAAQTQPGTARQQARPAPRPVTWRSPTHPAPPAQVTVRQPAGDDWHRPAQL